MSGFPEDESAWLIEMDGPLYWSGRDGCRAWWSVADAVRFCRWDDADRLRRLMGFEKARVREHVWPRTVMPAVVRPVPSVEPEPPPAPVQAGWTEEQERATASVSRVLHDEWIRFRDDPLRTPNPLHAMCAAIASVAPHFAPKVRVKLPERLPIEPVMRQETFERRTTYNQAIDACAAAIRAAGAEIEGEQ